MPHPIEPLGPGDLPACLALARDRRWAAEEHKWRLLFEVGTVFGLRDEAGALAGTTILTRYGDGLAVISMVLVAARYGRRGFGRRLMTHALTEAGAGTTVMLNATEQGRPLYERLGFVPAGVTHMHVGSFSTSGVPAAGSRPAGPADLPAIRRLDADVLGADRTRLLERLPGFLERMRVVERGGAVTGYGGVWRNVDNVVVGPVIAKTDADARLLISDLAATVDGPVRLDLDGRHPGLRAWATGSGFAPMGTTAVMVREGRPLPGDRRRWYVPVMQALG